MSRKRLLVRLIAPFVAAAVAAGMLSACDAPSDPWEDIATAFWPESPSIAFVVGNRANSGAPDVDTLLAQLPETLPDGGRVTVTVVSGDPNGVAGGVWDFVATNPGADLDAMVNIRAEVHEALLTVWSDTEEANLSGAIAAAARSLDGAAGEHHVIVWDSGVATAGVVDFASGSLLSVTGEDLVDAIAPVDLPVLSGRIVSWYGLGSTVAPQKQLPQRDQFALVDIWTAFLNAADAESVEFVGGASAAVLDGDLPTVTTVDPSAAAAGPVAACLQVIPQTEIRFSANRPDFVDGEHARTVLGQYAEAIRGCDGDIVVYGTTASGDASIIEWLAPARAEAGRDLLASLLGVSASSIRAVGLGFVGPCDRDESGRLIESIAAGNRTIVIGVGASQPDTTPQCPSAQ